MKRETKVLKSSQAILEFEPMNAIANNRSFIQKSRNKLRRYFWQKYTKSEIEPMNYDELWKKIIHKKKVIKR